MLSHPWNASKYRVAPGESLKDFSLLLFDLAWASWGKRYCSSDYTTLGFCLGTSGGVNDRFLHLTRIFETENHMNDLNQLPPHQTETIQSGDCEIFFRSFGAPGETPVLILHGQSYFSYDWVGIADQLASDREVVAMDMRGFGNSSWSPSKSYKVQDFASDAIAVANEKGWDRFVLIGHSMGGRNATYTASAYPDRIEKLILVDYTPTNAKAGSQRIMNVSVNMPSAFADKNEALAYFNIDPADAGANILARWDAYLMPVDGGLTVRRDIHFKEQFRKMRDEGVKPDHGADLWECLKNVQCPTLVMRGRSSDLFAPEMMEKVRAANERLTLVEVDGGHNIPGDNPNGVVRETASFIR